MEQAEPPIEQPKPPFPVSEATSSSSSDQRRSERLRRRTSLQVSSGSSIVPPPPSPAIEGVESILLKQFSSPKGAGSPMRSRSREESGTPPTPGATTAGIPFGRGRPTPSSSSVSGLRDRAHTVSGPSPRRFAAGRAPSAASPNDYGDHKHGPPSSTGAVQRGPGFLRSGPAPSSSSATPSSPGAAHPSSSSSSLASVHERVTGVSPQFVFLQLYRGSCFGEAGKGEAPIPLPATTDIERSIKNLDRIHAYVFLIISGGK